MCVQTSLPDIGHGRGRGLLYEISHDDGMTWSYWADLYAMEKGSREHVGSPIVRGLDDETVLVVYHRGRKVWSLANPPYGRQLIGASWLSKVPASDPKAGKLLYPEK